MKKSLVLLSAVFWMATCGGDGGTASGTYADKCTAACKDPKKSACNAQIAQLAKDCQNGCVAATEGLKIECAQCMIEHTGYFGNECVCYPGGCDTCGFATFAGGTSPCASACTPAKET